MTIIQTFADKIENFIMFNQEYISRRMLPDGSTVLVSSKENCLFPFGIPRLKVVEDTMDEFSDEKVYFLVNESDNDSVQILPESDYWAMYNEQVEMNKIFDEMNSLFSA